MKNLGTGTISAISHTRGEKYPYRYYVSVNGESGWVNSKYEHQNGESVNVVMITEGRWNSFIVTTD